MEKRERRRSRRSEKRREQPKLPFDSDQYEYSCVYVCVCVGI